MSISTEQIKQLRELTDVSIGECKKALEESNGDLENAKAVLRERSIKASDKKSDRTLGAGIVASYLHQGGLVGAMVELLCETDFVAKNEDFKVLARDIAMQVAATPEFDQSTLLEAPFIKNPEQTIANLIQESILKFGEKIEVGQVARFAPME